MYHSVVRMIFSTFFTLLLAGLAAVAPVTGDEAFFFVLFVFLWFFCIEAVISVYTVLVFDEFTRVIEVLLTTCQVIAVILFAAIVQVLF